MAKPAMPDLVNTPLIDGETQIYATIGNPVAQIRAPRVMLPIFAAIGVNAVWIPLAVPAEGLPIVLQALEQIENFRGFSVTVPHKPAITALLDRLSLRAQASGAANLVRIDPDGTRYGDMVDGLGCVRGLSRAGHAVEGRSAWILGVGGAGSAVAAALCEAGIGELFLSDRESARVEAAIGRLSRFFPRVRVTAATKPPTAIDLFINATPLGMGAGDPLPIAVEAIPRKALVCEVIMRPAETRLLIEARRRGHSIHHGRHMLDGQIALYLEFFGLPALPEATLIELVGRIPP